jgi:hypothetical protein
MDGITTADVTELDEAFDIVAASGELASVVDAVDDGRARLEAVLE